MSRPKPNVLLEEIDDNMRSLQVCEADAIFAVFYRGKPINLKTNANVEVPYPGPKYAKTSFPNSAHAFNLAEKLNKKFDCEDFSVVMLTTGRTLS